MALQFQCSKCKQLIRVEEQHFGKVVKCPKCETSLKVPDAPSVSSPEKATDPLVGKQIAHYKIESLLGQGGMGKVYKARNVRLDKSCAIKILPPEFARQDESSIQRFIREARSAANVEHPNVLPVHNVGKVGDDYFIEMSYADGGDLDGLLAKRGRLDVREAARIIRDIASALDAAHEQGIIHRDIKPSNVMFTKRGRALVADFGLAKMGQATTALTMSGAIVGTPLYMSPEQCSGQELDQRSDIYSLGVMFYQMLAGKPPYGAPDVVGLIGQHIHAPIPDIRNDVGGVPERTALIIQKMMAKNPDERYQSCREVVSNLDAILTPRPVAAVAVKKKSRAPAYIATAVVIVLIAVVSTFVVIRRGTEHRAPTSLKNGRVHPAGRASPTKGSAAVKAAATEPQADAERKRKVESRRPDVPSVIALPPKAGEAIPSTEKAEPKLPQVEPKPTTPPIIASTAETRDEAISPAEKAARRLAVNLITYQMDIKPVNDLIDEMKYTDAGLRANLLKSKYPDLIARKLKNLEAVRSLRQRCIERINSGAARVSMGDISRRYAFAGPIESADDTGLSAAIKKRWNSLDKEESVNFYRKASDPTSPENAIGIAAFLMEGNSPDFDAAMIALGQAAKHGADVSPDLKYIETLKKSQAEYAEAEKRGKALETAAVERRGVALPPPETAAPKVEGPEPKTASYDGVYVATAATGEKIPHPLSGTTYKIVYQGKKIDVPEGMVFIPAGPFLMGSAEAGEYSGFMQKEVYLDAYLIDKYEITNAQYMEFVRATNHRIPKHWEENGGEIPEGRENHPVVYVSWEDAKAYCDWCGKRLPTEAEWEKAAGWDLKKREQRRYPWGNNYDPSRANHCHQLGCRCEGDIKVHTAWWEKWSKSAEGKKINPLGGNTAPVGQFKDDVSSFGCFDMGGNVREWVADWYDPDYYKVGPKKDPTGPTEEEAPLIDDRWIVRGKRCRVLRGGCWSNRRYYIVSFSRAFSDPTNSDYIYLGFRCAADYPWKPPEEKSEVRSQEPEVRRTEQEQPQQAQIENYDDVYVTEAATGEKIPHPLSRKTYKIVYKGKKIDVPEGMVFVPPGPFLMGRDDSNNKNTGYIQKEVYLDGYFIDKFEVTNAQYMEFVKATNHPMPHHWQEHGGKIPNGRENHPVVYVSWEDAKAYCDWCGKRLPTEAEWEKAAGWDMKRGKHLEYPWGDEYDPRRANDCYQSGCRCNGHSKIHTPWWEKWSKSEEGKRIIALGGNTAPVGQFKGDESFFKCFDMGGNVREWVSDWYREDYYKVGPKKDPRGPTEAEATLIDGKPCRVARGGPWHYIRGNLRASCRDRLVPTTRPYHLGFRCAADYPWKPPEQKQ